MYQFNTHKEYPHTPVTPICTVTNLHTGILEQAHTLIAGSTGSGKSVLINGLIYTIMAGGLGQMILCDPKRVEMRMYKDVYDTLAFADTPSDIRHALEEAHAIMMNRYDELSAAGKREYDGKHIYVIVDEFADLIMDKENGKAIVDLLQSLCQLGRAAHIHCILATQAPSRKVLKAEITLNMTCQVALHCRSAIESKQIIGMPGAEQLPLYGDCIVNTAAGAFRHRDIKMYSEEEIQSLIDCILSQRTIPESKPERSGLRWFRRRATA